MKDSARERRTNGTPFVFGVSGHRDLVQSDLPELSEQLRTVFDRFRAAYPEAVFELLTPLAEGADRVAAQLAASCGIKLRVPMPMSQSEYEQDFTTPESLAEFRRLLAAADAHWEVSNDSPDQLSSGEPNSRALKYAAVGDLIARTSDVLILFWDGRDNQKVGGTAWVKKRREHWMDLAERNGGERVESAYSCTIQIVTPRQTSDGTARPHIEIVGHLPVVADNYAEDRSRL